jgi:hypothetical protein
MNHLLMPLNRDRAKIAIARQVAINNGQTWERLNHANQNRYLTLAENILATVERLQSKYDWNMK